MEGSARRSRLDFQGIPALVSGLADQQVRVAEASALFLAQPDCLPDLGNTPRQGAKNKKLNSFGRVTRPHSEGVHVKVVRSSNHPQPSNSHPAFPRGVFFFYEKNTGVAHFQVDAGSDGAFPVDEAAGLLAMHCMVRSQSPSDYIVMVQAADEILEGLNEKANKLLEAGKSVRSQVKLTRREEEVLSGVMQSLANKEIAANLNLSERTIKFHVSSLLGKFNVRGRMELVREASRQTAGGVPMPMPVGTREVPTVAPVARDYRAARRSVSVVPLAKRQLMA